MDTAVTPVEFREGAVEVDGVRLRYREAGQGSVLVHLPGPDGLTPAHGLLAQRFRVVVVEAGPPPRPPTMLAQAMRRLGLDAFDLMGTASDGATALGLALLEPTRVRALVLEAPTEGSDGDLERRLPDVATPTLVLLGTRDEAAASALGRACKARIAGSHLVFVYDAGAAIGRDRPQAFAEVVADFLERREAFVISRARTVLHP